MRAKGRGLKAQRIGKMRGKIGPIVAAGIEMKLMGNAPGVENIVKGLSAGIEPVIILGAAVEVDFHSRKIRGSGDSERVIAVPKQAIRGGAENVSQKPQASQFERIAHGDGGQAFHQRGALSAYRCEHLRMEEGHAQGAIAAHGYSADAARVATRGDAV